MTVFLWVCFIAIGLMGSLGVFVLLSMWFGGKMPTSTGGV